MTELSRAELTGKRQAGVLLHPSSLPSGKLDKDALRWIDWLAEAGLSVWQMLPLGVPLAGASPYQCSSAFALNPALFPKKLPSVRVTSAAFKAWHQVELAWVDDYALFTVLKKIQGNTPWFTWPQALRQRDATVLNEFSQQHEKTIREHVRQQYQLFLYWQGLRAYAHQRGIELFGDMPIFVAHDSADVWLHPEFFLLDEQGMPTLVAGVPPDYFSPTGQRWGNPQYDWDFLRNTEFAWWQERLRYHFECFDLVRIDHFRGLAASWMIPAASETAIEGYWQPVPGAALLQRIRDTLGLVSLVAEDLGLITPDVELLRKQFNLPGMSVLQFAFDGFVDNPHKPENVTVDRVYYTGTHDNDTALGWFNSLDATMQTLVKTMLNIDTPEQVLQAMIITVLSSKAELAMMPLQDLLKLGADARMNTPGTITGNWQWRFDWAQLPASLSSELRQLLTQTERLPHA